MRFLIFMTLPVIRKDQNLQLVLNFKQWDCWRVPVYFSLFPYGLEYCIDLVFTSLAIHSMKICWFYCLYIFIWCFFNRTNLSPKSDAQPKPVKYPSDCKNMCRVPWLHVRIAYWVACSGEDLPLSRRWKVWVNLNPKHFANL